MSFWTEERVAEAARLKAAGYSSSQVARLIGAPSRNAVIGVLHRRGISGGKWEWTPERDEELRRLHGMKLSMREIGYRIGIGAASVAKRIGKLGLPRNSISEQMFRHHGSTPKSSNNPVPRVRKLIPPPKPPAEPPNCEPVSLMLHGSDQCAFPVRDFTSPDAPFFCGAPRDTHHPSYCAWHRAIAAGVGTASERAVFVGTPQFTFGSAA